MDGRNFIAGAALIGSILSFCCRHANPVSETNGWEGVRISSTYYALINGTIIDGTGATPVQDGVVVIKEGNIIAVGSKGSVEVPAEALTVDVHGATILPGIINAHVHRAFDETALRNWAWNGVTTVRDEAILSSLTLEAALAFRDSSREKPDCSTLITAGFMLTVPGGYGGMAVSSPADARQKVSDQLDKGVDLIKFSQEDGYAGRSDLPKLSIEEMSAIVAAAHERRTVVSAHITQSEYWAVVVQAGVDDVAHVAYDPVSDAVLNDMVSKGILLVPTFTVFRNFGAPVSVCIDNVRRFVQRGGVVALGNDFGGGPGNFDEGVPWYELNCMLESGMTRMQILVASTRNAARAAHVENIVGTLEAGKVADVLVVKGDPMTDLNALSQVRLVIHHGINIRVEK